MLRYVLVRRYLFEGIYDLVNLLDERFSGLNTIADTIKKVIQEVLIKKVD